MERRAIRIWDPCGPSLGGLAAQSPYDRLLRDLAERDPWGQMLYDTVRAGRLDR